MRILQPLEAKALVPEAPAAASPLGKSDLGRFDALERTVKSILARLQAIEQRRRDVSLPSVLSSPPFPKITVDEKALRNGLFTKMWKVLNDERASKAA